MSNYTIPCNHDRVVVGAVIADVPNSMEFVQQYNAATLVEKTLALMQCVKCGDLTEEQFSVEMLAPLLQLADIALGVTRDDSEPAGDS